MQILETKMIRFVKRVLILALILPEEAKGCTWRDSPVGCSSGPCGVGTYYNVIAKECVACPKGYYMAADGHSCSSCRPCTVAMVENKEVELEVCTPFRDAKIGCDENYFMAGRNGLHPEYACWRCSGCKENESLLQGCTADKNTVCTSNRNRKAAKTVVTNILEQKSLACWIGDYTSIYTVCSLFLLKKIPFY